jgi:uncharacterized protein with HEPN domain
MKHPKPYLLNIIDSIEAIRTYIPPSEKEFLENQLSQDAILMRLQDIGENLIRLRDLFPDYWDTNATDAWHRGIGLRNIISHTYGDIDFAIIWSLINKDLKPFSETIKKLL